MSESEHRGPAESAEPNRETIEEPARARRVAPRAELAVTSFGLALGIVSALTVFVIGIGAGLFGWGILVVQVLSSLYIGYEPSFVGAVSGAVWAFVGGLIGGALIAWLYNRLVARRR